MVQSKYWSCSVKSEKANEAISTLKLLESRLDYAVIGFEDSDPSPDKHTHCVLAFKNSICAGSIPPIFREVKCKNILAPGGSYLNLHLTILPIRALHLFGTIPYKSKNKPNRFRKYNERRKNEDSAERS